MSEASRRFRVFDHRNLDAIRQLAHLSPRRRLEITAVANVYPFRVNEYVVDRLIDWDNIPDDPMFQLTFPQPGMVEDADLQTMCDLLAANADRKRIQQEARRIQLSSNPHPAGQQSDNVPFLDGEPVRGVQHKYRETVLVFPDQGQTCHSYCTYCFRWPQFIGVPELRFAVKDAERVIDYIRSRKEVRSVLLTGGDPLVMKTRLLRRYIEPLLEIEHVTSVRIGTKAVAYWPHRFVQGADAEDLLRLFHEVSRSGRTLALMAHYSHPCELSTDIAQTALESIRQSGALVRTQAPLIRHVNDSAETWRDLWSAQVRLGAVPYYMFMERDTGPRAYFEVPIVKALEVYSRAHRSLSGLGRTARGPVMSCKPGKVLVSDVTTLDSGKAFVLSFIQARDPAVTGRVFFAHYDERATWFDQLRLLPSSPCAGKQPPSLPTIAMDAE